jgi:hypothetical protein
MGMTKIVEKKMAGSGKLKAKQYAREKREREREREHRMFTLLWTALCSRKKRSFRIEQKTNSLY